MPEAKYMLAGLGGLACGAVVLGYTAYAMGVLSPTAPARVAPPAAQPAPAQPTPVQPTVDQNDPRALVLAVMLNTGVGTTLSSRLVAVRDKLVRSHSNISVTEAQAVTIVDTYIAPEFRRRMPELLLRIQGVMMHDFTVPELRALLSGEDSDALRTARAKSVSLQEHFNEVAQQWSVAVGVDAFKKYVTEITRIAPMIRPPK